MPFNFYKLYSLRLEDIDTQIIFKAECFNLKYISFHNCDFTSINIDASPVTVGLFFCKYLKDFTTNLTKCEGLVISTCHRLFLSSLFNGDTLSFLQLYSLTLRNIHHQIQFKADCPKFKDVCFDNCDLTSIELVTQPLKFNLSSCKYLKIIKPNLVDCEELKISNCLSLSRFFGDDVILFPKLTLIYFVSCNKISSYFQSVRNINLIIFLLIIFFSK